MSASRAEFAGNLDIEANNILRLYDRRENGRQPHDKKDETSR